MLRKELVMAITVVLEKSRMADRRTIRWPEFRLRLIGSFADYAI